MVEHDPRFRIDHAELVIPGLQNTYRLLQLSDSHMSPDSPLDSDEMREKAAKHREIWMGHGNGIPQEENVEAFVRYAKTHDVDVALLAGDMTDFPSVGTAAEGVTYYEQFDRYLYVAGNHEQGLRFPELYAAAVKGDCPALQVMELGELTLVGVDNGMHTVPDEAMDALETILHGDKPVILLHHVPVDCQTLHPAAVEYWDDVTYFLFGGSGEGENVQRYIDLLSKETTQLKAVVAGHLHFDHVDTFENGVVQYVSAPCLAGYARVIDIKGDRSFCPSDAVAVR